MSIPPKVGMAIGTIMSAPLPVEDSTGKRAIKVEAVVMAAGRIRLRPAFTTGFNDFLFGLWVLFLENLMDIGSHQHAIVGGNTK